MNEQEIFEKVKVIVVEQLGVEEEKVTKEATFVDDLAADSLDIVELVMSREEEFDIEIDDSEAEKIVTIGDVVEVNFADSAGNTDFSLAIKAKIVRAEVEKDGILYL